MSKKKKNKIKTLTDQQYNDYLMALKDERPVMGRSSFNAIK